MKSPIQGYRFVDWKTDAEVHENGCDCVVSWFDGESPKYETYTHGCADSLYDGNSLERARRSLDLTNQEWDSLLSIGVEYLEKI